MRFGPVRFVDHTGAYRVEFDTAVAGQAVVTGIDQRRLEPAFPEYAGTAVESVNWPDIILAQILHDSGHTLWCGRCNEQMGVVGQQDIGMQSAIMCSAGRRQGSLHRHRNRPAGYYRAG